MSTLVVTDNQGNAHNAHNTNKANGNKSKRNRYYRSKKPSKTLNTQRHFTLLRVDFHQTTEAYLGPAGGEKLRTLGHVDRAYVLFTETEEAGSQAGEGDGGEPYRLRWPAPATLVTLARKVYAHRLLGKMDSFVSLLEVNVQQKVVEEMEKEFTTSSSPQNEVHHPSLLSNSSSSSSTTKYSFLMAVLSVPGQTELIVVPLSASAFLRPGAKCFELLSKSSSSSSQTTSCIHQRPYHLISGPTINAKGNHSEPSQTSLVCGDYRVLLVKPPSGWLFLVELNSKTGGVVHSTTPSLLTSNQYVALSGAPLMTPAGAANSKNANAEKGTKMPTSNNFNKRGKGGRFVDGSTNYQHQNLPSQEELLPSSGDGVLVQYGAIISFRGGYQGKVMTSNEGGEGGTGGGGGGKPSGVGPRGKRQGRILQSSKVASKEVPPSNSISNSNFIFMGEFASPVISFSRLQARLNLAASLVQEISWPELPKAAHSKEGNAGGGGKKKLEVTKKEKKKKKLAKVEVEGNEIKEDEQVKSTTSSPNLAVGDAEGNCSQLVAGNFDPSKDTTTTTTEQANE